MTIIGLKLAGHYNLFNHNWQAKPSYQLIFFYDCMDFFTFYWCFKTSF